MNAGWFLGLPSGSIAVYLEKVMGYGGETTLLETKKSWSNSHQLGWMLFEDKAIHPAHSLKITLWPPWHCTIGQWVDEHPVPMPGTASDDQNELLTLLKSLSNLVFSQICTSLFKASSKIPDVELNYQGQNDGKILVTHRDLWLRIVPLH